MGTAFWIRRFVTVLVLASVVIALAQWAKGHTLQYASIQGLIWGFLASGIFTGGRIIQSRRKQHCVICRDTPELANPDRGDA